MLLVHNDAPDPINAMREYMIEFADLCERGGVAVGVTRMDVRSGLMLTDYTDVLERERPDLMVPVMPVDPRDRGNMEMLLMSMIASPTVESSAVAAVRCSSDNGRWLVERTSAL